MRKVSNVKEMNENAMGHNSKAQQELIQKYVTNIAKWTLDKKAIDEKIREELASAKEDGLSKMAIRGTVKEMMMSDEQKASRDEVESERQRYTELCADLPLFKKVA
jgi:DNA-binding TFAR19-related protein (PDSD5 family)